MMPRVMPIQDLTRQQDVSGVQPIFQNIGNQQAMQNAAMQQAMALTQQAGQTGQQGGGGMNPMMLAQMLRGGKKGSYLSYVLPMMRYGAGNVYGGFGQGQVPTTTTGMD
jgi:hypothetical protein